ncbi:branched-chain amino acid ABC transporter permease [Knoellia sp. 3-2P3]|uniref:branched-chain amino acid ABC transporter permease n=1 Tax=unclassified Knoellia TaxID=2618719 RepID=UPI0023DBA691|nr:branched-chain amino acid ABC transporter permease [Knoellia sp. 3-2P3]MDF2092302.1 branched-chain amino acid ABC transporter permease [Knoellia sp. 3-2P3]
MSEVVLLVLTGVGLGALYFLAASGLSLIYGLMGVLNFAHGAFMVAGAYAGWLTMTGLPDTMGAGVRLAVALVVALAVGAGIGLLVEVVLIRPLYRHHIQQVLVTVGLSLAAVAAVQGIWGSDAHPLEKPRWLASTTDVAGAQIPNDRFLFIAAALLLFGTLMAVLHLTRLGLVIRAGVENRSMVEALGIDVQRTFSVVFAVGGAAAGLAGLLGGVYASSVSPLQGGSMLIFAFIVVVIGGMGSLVGTAVAAVAVGLVQQLANYYAASGVGDLSVVLLLALVLLVRPASMQGAH